MRIWIDVTNSPHVVLFRPLVGLLIARGHDVTISARDFAQTVELLEAAGLAHTVVGPPHGGASRAGKVRAMASRLRALRGFARDRAFDLALTHASHELPMVARSLGIPSSYAFDYEFARAQHGLGCRAATRIVVPEVIPQERLDPLGARARKVRTYPGLKEEYYLHGFTPDASVPARLGVDPSRILVVVRTPPEVSLYHRHANPLFVDVLERLGARPDGQGGRAAANRGTARGDRESKAALARRPGACGRCSQPGRPGRSRRLGRGDDEPRGGRARHPRLHHVHGQARRGRRAAASGGPAAVADRRRRTRRRAEGARNAATDTCAGRAPRLFAHRPGGITEYRGRAYCPAVDREGKE